MEMMRLQKNGQGFTEFEEDIHFDEDDPDFDNNYQPHQHHGVPALRVPIFLTVPTKMSLASVHPVDLHSNTSSLTLSHSMDDVASWSSSSGQVLTIEQVRHQLSSCFTCGVTWTDGQVSLDCAECGGYSVDRPCPVCDGDCGSMWKRDLSMSHSSGKARWLGVCLNENKEPDPDDFDDDQPLIVAVKNKAAVDEHLAEELCQRLQQLAGPKGDN